MNLKVLILCIGFSGLLYIATGSGDASLGQQNLLESESKQPGIQKDASPSVQLTTDGRIGELELPEDTTNTVDIIWKIPDFFKLPYRRDAGIISPDFNSRGFKGYFVMDPKGSANTSGVINFKSLIIPHVFPHSTETYLRVLLKAEDGTLKTYVTNVSFRNYFTCNVPKMDIIGNKESMVPGGVLTVLFKLSIVEDRYSERRNPEVTPSLASMSDVGDLHARRISSKKFAMTWKLQDFFSFPEYRQLDGTLPRISDYFFFHAYLTPKGIYSKAGFTRLQLYWRYTGDVPPEKKVPYPKFSCKFSLKTGENTLHNITGESSVAQLGGSCDCLIPWSEIYERKDSLVPRGELTVVLNFDLVSEDVEPETQTASNTPDREEEWTTVLPGDTETGVQTNPRYASPSVQLTTDGRIGELELLEDTTSSVDIIWKIPDFFKLPYRRDAGIISPDFNSRGFKGYFVMDPKGSTNTSGVINFNSLIISRDHPRKETYLQVFLKAEDGTLKPYVTSVNFRNYFTCEVSKMDILRDKGLMVPGGALTVLFKLSRVDEDSSSRNEEVTPSLSSMYSVGDLHARRISSKKFAMTWKFQDFFSLPVYRQLTGTLSRISDYFFFHIYLTPKGRSNEAGFTRLQLSWRYTGDVPPEKKVPYPKFSCKFSLKTGENTLHNITEEKYHVALLGGFCHCLIPWSEIYERKDSLVPRGELTVVLDFDLVSEDAEPETQTETTTSSHSDVLSGRIGELEISRDTPTSVDITWTIKDFFTMPYQPDSGIVSPDFNSLRFKGFFVMDPKGSATTPGDLQFRSVIFRHDVPRGKIYFKLFLKMLNGTFTEFAVKVPFDNYFTSDISKLKIVEEKDIFAPGGVLTVLFRLSTTGNFADNLKSDCECKLEKKEVKNCDWKILVPFAKMSSDFLELYKTGSHSDTTLKCGDEEFAVHKSILSARSSVFSDMFKSDRTENGRRVGYILEIENTFTLTDIQCSTLDLLLKYIYSATVDDLPRDKKQQLLEAAQRYGVE